MAAPLSDEEQAFHLLSRFTPGPTTELVAEVMRAGIKEWLEKQLKSDPKDPELLKGTESLALTSAEIFREFDKPVPEKATEKERRQIEERRQVPTRELLHWVLRRAVQGRNPVREALADFFRNHFAVSVEKDEVRHLAVDWEREIIWKRSLGNFGEMLDATAHHPAMLIYLDNHLSRRPPTASELKQIEQETRRQTGSRDRAREAVDIARQRGLNENYARELMELHTLGVDRFYTQPDVIAVAKCLTGWTIDREKWEFAYNRDLHCQEKKFFLGATINPKADSSEGEWVLEVLKAHKGTALFLAWKLCRWFVNDEPDEAMVKRIAQVFLPTRGDMPRVIKAIVEHPAFFARENFRCKFKRPWEFVVSALRVTQAELTNLDGIIFSLAAMNESLYRCADPTGYYDQAEAWRDPGAMATRWTFVTEFAAGRLPGVKIPASFYADLPAGRPEEWSVLLARKILPVVGLSPTTSANVDKIVRNSKAAPERLGPMITAVLLGSPDFQKQ